MRVYDLLGSPFAPAGCVLNHEEFFRQVRALWEQLTAPPDESRRNRKTDAAVTQRGLLREYVRLCRAGIAALAREGDQDTVHYVICMYGIRSRELLAVGEGLPLAEFNLLQVRKESEEELTEEIQMIQNMQLSITTRSPKRIPMNPPAEVPVTVLTPMFRYGPKYSKAALFQGLEGIAEFYHDRYDRPA